MYIRRQSKHMFNTGAISTLLLVYSQSAGQNQVDPNEGMKVYFKSFYVLTITPTTLNELQDSGALIGLLSEPGFLNELNGLLEDFDSYKSKPKYRIADYKIGMIFKLNDGQTGYIAGNNFPYIDYNGRVIKDKKYCFLKLLVKYIDNPELEKFVKNGFKLSF